MYKEEENFLLERQHHHPKNKKIQAMIPLWIILKTLQTARHTYH